MEKLGANYNGEGSGALRKVSDNDLDELKRIFEVTGGQERYDRIEEFSKQKAEEMGLELGPGMESEYFKHVYTANNQKHNHQ